jgi:hypothetical protein
MNAHPIDTLFFPFADATFANKTVLSQAFGKVKGLLEEYALSRNIDAEDLRLLDVCDDRGEIHPKLLKFIDSLPRRPKQTQENYRKYKNQNRCIIKRVINCLLGKESDKAKGEVNSLIMDGAPEFLKPLFPLLQRRRGTFSANKPGWRETRDKAPLSDSAQRILLTLIEVSKQHDIDTIESLFLEHGMDIRHTLLRSMRRAEWDNISGYYSTFLEKVRKKYDLPFTKGRWKSATFDELPAKLRAELNVFKERALHGIDSYKDLMVCAVKYKGKKEPFEESTIWRYVESVQHAFGCILRSGLPVTDDIGVRELMEIGEVEREQNGATVRVPGNYLVEPYHKQECEMITDRKRAGFESENFHHFRLALKAVAAFNGNFDLQEPFTKAYPETTDKSTKRRVKDERKKEWKLPLLDKAIAEMRPRFLRIMKGRLYELRSP